MSLNQFYTKVTVAAEPGGYEPQDGDNFERRSGFAYKLPDTKPYTIRNSKNGQQTKCSNMDQVKRILTNVVRLYGREALETLYVDKAGDKDPFYGKDLV